MKGGETMKRKFINVAKFEVVIRSCKGTSEILTESVKDLRTGKA